MMECTGRHTVIKPLCLYEVQISRGIVIYIFTRILEFKINI